MPLRLPILLAAGCLVACLGPASAQDRSRQADEDACQPDVFRLCASEIPDETGIVGRGRHRHDEVTPSNEQDGTVGRMDPNPWLQSVDHGEGHDAPDHETTDDVELRIRNARSEGELTRTTTTVGVLA